MSPDPWVELRRRTAARIALGRTGGSLPTSEQLAFRLAHAGARDAVLSAFDTEGLAAQMGGIAAYTAATDRQQYLQRPDLGRMLAAPSRAHLIEKAAGLPGCDLVIIVSDGLSTLAAETQSAHVIGSLRPQLEADGWTIAPIIVARHARVALQDEIGEIFRASISLMLLGERPGLGSADSLGAYFTYAPRPGRTDAERNCVSNIRDGGLAPTFAAAKLYRLLTESRTLRLSGVHLKDEPPVPSLDRSANDDRGLPAKPGADDFPRE